MARFAIGRAETTTRKVTTVPNFYHLDRTPTEGNDNKTRNDERTKHCADAFVEWCCLIGKSTLFGVPIASALDAILVYGILH